MELDATVIDCALSAEWEQLLRQLSSRAAAAGSEESPACTAFVAMLTRLQLDDATHPDAKSTPSAAPESASRFYGGTHNLSWSAAPVFVYVGWLETRRSRPYAP